MCFIMLSIKKQKLLMHCFHNNLTLQYPKASMKEKEQLHYFHTSQEVEYFKSLYDDEEVFVNRSERFKGQCSIGSSPKCHWIYISPLSIIFRLKKKNTQIFFVLKNFTEIKLLSQIPKNWLDVVPTYLLNYIPFEFSIKYLILFFRAKQRM